jgi:competence protein ComEA
LRKEVKEFSGKECILKNHSGREYEMKIASKYLLKAVLIVCAVSLLLGTAGFASDSHAGGDVVNINKATVKELASLPGIGKKKAEAIFAYRQDHGQFKDAQELVKVEGIGKKTYEKIKERISV